MKPFSILLFIASVCLAIAVLTSHWTGMSGDEYSGHSGLFSNVSCEHDDCHTEILVKYIAKGLGLKIMLGIVTGVLTLLGGLAAAVCTAIAGFTTMNGKRGPTSAALIIAAVTGGLGVVFMLVFIGFHPSVWGFSWYLFLGGVACAVIGAILANGAIPAPRPMMMMMHPGMPGMPGLPMGMMPPMGMQPGFMQPPQMQQPMTPPCNQCGGQTQWVAQYGKLFCGRCNRYIV